MKPNFALSLSFEGIRLLHRAAGGWREVGEVSLTSKDLAGELAVLRKTASALEPGGVRSKLIIPNEQIKYLALNTPSQSDASRRVEVKMALKQATPYALEELAYDVSLEGDVTHVAAVAKETLSEAEAFANEHRFHPVSFVAIPGENHYIGEPYFGETTQASTLLDAGEKVEPDGIAVVVLGPVAKTTTPEPAKEDTKPDRKAVDDAPVDDPEPDEAEPEAESASPSDGDGEGKPDSQEKADNTGATDNAALTDTTETSEDDVSDDAPAKKAKPDGQNKKSPDPDLPVPGGTTKDKPEETRAPQNAAPKPSTPKPVRKRLKETDYLVPFRPGATADASSAAPAKDTPLEPPAAASVVVPDAAQPAANTGGFVSRRKKPDEPEPNTHVPSQAQVNAGIVVDGAEIVPDSTSLKPDEPAIEPQTDRPKGGFLSRRKAARAPKKEPVLAASTASMSPLPAPRPAPLAPPKGEAERMTVFGARKTDRAGRSRLVAILLTVVLLVFLAGVAAWAAVFVDDGLAGLFRSKETRATASAPDFQVEPQIIRTPIVEDDPIDPAATEVAALDPESAVLPGPDGTAAPSQPDSAQAISPEEAAARYAVTGYWPYAPTDNPTAPADLVGFDNVFLTSVDPVSGGKDAIALPSIESLNTDIAMAAIASPPAPGTNFALDAQGLVIPHVNGALSPDGYTVFAGRPALVPPPIPARFRSVPNIDTERVTLAGFRPKTRPASLADDAERAQLDGLTLRELARLRPKLRPQSVQQTAQAAAEEEVEDPDDPIATATRLAARESTRPDARPGNFNRIVRRAQRTPQPSQGREDEVRTASVRTLAPRTVTPSIPSKASVARSATVKNAINLNRVNLIGVYGKPSSRRALVRLSNGRYKKVTVGDRIDGGRVSAIGNSELRYRKGSRNVVLKMPKG